MGFTMIEGERALDWVDENLDPKDTVYLRRRPAEEFARFYKGYTNVVMIDPPAYTPFGWFNDQFTKVYVILTKEPMFNRDAFLQYEDVQVMKYVR